MVPAAPQATSPRLLGQPPGAYPRPDGSSPGARVSASQAMPPWAPRNLCYDEMIRPGWPAGLQSPAGSIHEPPSLLAGRPPERYSRLSPHPVLRPASPRPALQGPATRGLPSPPALPPSSSSWGPEGTLGCSWPDSLLSPRLPKQVTLSTLSRPRFGLSHFYLRVHPEKEGGKKSRGDPSQLERKNFKRVSTAAKKPRLCRPSNDNKAFRRAQGDSFPPRSDQKPGTLGHIPPLAGRENSTLPPEAPFLALGKHSGP